MQKQRSWAESSTALSVCTAASASPWCKNARLRGAEAPIPLSSRPRSLSSLHSFRPRDGIPNRDSGSVTGSEAHSDNDDRWGGGAAPEEYTPALHPLPLILCQEPAHPQHAARPQRAKDDGRRGAPHAKREDDVDRGGGIARGDRYYRVISFWRQQDGLDEEGDSGRNRRGARRKGDQEDAGEADSRTTPRRSTELPHRRSMQRTTMDGEPRCIRVAVRVPFASPSRDDAARDGSPAARCVREVSDEASHGSTARGCTPA
jgi:hypothetical protein